MMGVGTAVPCASDMNVASFSESDSPEPVGVY